MSGLVPHVSESKAHPITIRRFSTPEEMEVCVDLQKAVWGFSDMETVPHRMFVVAHRTGGQVIGAFDGGRAIGFLLGLMACREGALYIHSHMTAVTPRYQNQGIGRQLKLAQREDALARSINLIEWTFDPLQIRNAHFNIARLGAMVREYLPNVYGRTSSPLHRGLPTDRLVAQWWIREPRITSTLAGHAAELRAEKQVHVPRNIDEVCQRSPTEARELQSNIRQQFEHCFSEGLAVTGFAFDQENASYLLAHL
jgi:predicted GNAT superfamily acetyltransferase